MNEIDLDALSAEHLKRYWFISATAGSGDQAETRRVWDSRRLVPFVGPSQLGTLVEELFVRMPGLDDKDLEPLVRKLSGLDRHGAQRIKMEA
jgi:hypothetical protein